MTESGQETGDKRYGELNILEREDEVRPGKRSRNKSPEAGRVSWIRDPRPTFKQPGNQVEGGIQEIQEELGEQEKQEPGNLGGEEKLEEDTRKKEPGQEREGNQETTRQEDQEENEGGSRRRGSCQETCQETQEKDGD